MVFERPQCGKQFLVVVNILPSNRVQWQPVASLRHNGFHGFNKEKLCTLCVENDRFTKRIAFTWP